MHKQMTEIYLQKWRVKFAIEWYISIQIARVLFLLFVNDVV